MSSLSPPYYTSHKPPQQPAGRPGVSLEHPWLAMKAGDLVRGQEVIQVNSDTTVEEVCEVLIRHQISSVPIYDQQKGMYIGFFDLHDLCTYLLLLARAGPEKRRIKMFGKCLSENASTNGAEPPAPFSSQRSFRRRSSSLSMSSTIDSDDFAERFVAGRGSNSPVGTPTHRKSYASSDMPYARRENSGISLMSAVDLAASPNSELEVLARKIADQEPIPVKMLSDISTSNPFCSVLPETSIIQIMELFSMGTHRIAVIDGDGKFVGILTQSRLIQSVYDNMDHVSELSRILDTSLEDLGLTQKSVIFVNPNTPTFKALSLLSRWRITSLAIVDENRTLIGNLSLGDVKYLIRKQYRHLLYGTALSLVQMVRYQQGIEEGKDRIPVFGVRPNATLRHIITKLHATGSHRIWVTTDESSMIPASMPFSSQPNVLLPTAAISASFGGSPNFPFSSTSGNASTASGLNYRRHSLVIPNSQPSIKARTEWNRRVSFSGQFDDAVCSVVSLTDVISILYRELPRIGQPL